MSFKDKLKSRLKEDEFIFEYEDVHNGEFARQISEGKKPVCPRCASPVIFARTPEEAKNKNVPPGYMCSKNSNHLQIILNFAD